VKGNSHAPFWSSGRRSDPPIDCDGTRPAMEDTQTIRQNQMGQRGKEFWQNRGFI